MLDRGLATFLVPFPIQFVFYTYCKYVTNPNLEKYEDTKEEANEDYHFVSDNLNDIPGYLLTNPCYDESSHYDISCEKGQDIGWTVING